MEGTVTITVNVRELDLLTLAAVSMSKANLRRGRLQISGEFVELSDKLITTKEEMYWQQAFGNEEKPALDEQTS